MTIRLRCYEYDYGERKIMIVVLSRVIFWLFAFIIAWAMVGYQVSLKVLGRYSHIGD